MKITFDYSYIFVALSFILTGYFANLIVFTSIILVHELGHYLTAKYYNLDIKEITIYPYGGLVKINEPINTKISIDLKVAISGVIFQTIYYFIIIFLYKNNIIRAYIFNLFTVYNKSIFFFNMLPIHPLDGSKVLNLMLSKILPYKYTLRLNIFISIVTLIIVVIINYYKINYTTILIITVIMNNIIKYHKNINYNFNKFLLERYLYRRNYSKIKYIKTIENMYKEKYHVLKINNKYMSEKEFLKQKYKWKKMFDLIDIIC